MQSVICNHKRGKKNVAQIVRPTIQSLLFFLVERIFIKNPNCHKKAGQHFENVRDVILFRSCSTRLLIFRVPGRIKDAGMRKNIIQVLPDPAGQTKFTRLPQLIIIGSEDT